MGPGKIVWSICDTPISVINNGVEQGKEMHKDAAMASSAVFCQYLPYWFSA